MSNPKSYTEGFLRETPFYLCEALCNETAKGLPPTVDWIRNHTKHLLAYLLSD